MIVKFYRMLFIFATMCLSLPGLYSTPLRVMYMVQAGYPPRVVEERANEFTRQTGNAVEISFAEYDELYELVQNNSQDVDVFLLDTIWTADFVEQGLIDPVPQPLVGEIQRSMIPSIYRANSYNDQLWAMPFLANFQLLYTNMDLLRAAGFDRPPTSFADMEAMAARAKELGLLSYPIFDSLRNAEVLMCELVWTSGGFGHDWASDGSAIRFDRPEIHKTLDLWLRWLDDGLLNPLSLDASELLAADVFQWGDALFSTNWTFLIGRLAQGESDGNRAPSFEYQVSLLPRNVGVGRSASVSGFQGLAVSRWSSQKDLSWQFIRFLSNPEFQGQNLSEFPVWSQLWNQPRTRQLDPWIGVKEDQVGGIRFRPIHPDYQEISELVRNSVSDILQGTQTIAPELEALDRRLEQFRGEIQ